MKHLPILVCFIMFSTIDSAFGQKISEINFSLGVSRPSSTTSYSIYQDVPPAYLIFNASKSWYNPDSKFSIRKELGLNLQYSGINLSTSGLGANWNQRGSILSMFADASLLADYRINKFLCICFGPEVEFLFAGYYDLKTDYSSIYFNPPYSGHDHVTKINREYFDQPTYGIKLRLMESCISKNTTMGLSFSYLWTKREASNFYTTNYTRISLFIGLKKRGKYCSKKED